MAGERWFTYVSAITGTGTEDDPFRPAIYPQLSGHTWEAEDQRSNPAEPSGLMRVRAFVPPSVHNKIVQAGAQFLGEGRLK